LPCSQEPATSPILSQMNPVHPLPPYLPKIHSNIIHPPRSSAWSLLVFQPKFCMRLSPHPCALRTLPITLLDLSTLNSIWWSVQDMKHRIMQYLITYSYRVSFIILRSFLCDRHAEKSKYKILVWKSNEKKGVKTDTDTDGTWHFKGEMKITQVRCTKVDWIESVKDTVKCRTSTDSRWYLYLIFEEDI